MLQQTDPQLADPVAASFVNSGFTMDMVSDTVDNLQR